MFDVDSSERGRRIRQIVEELVTRRTGGDEVGDECLIAAHRNLMPELGEALHDLRRIERARQQAGRADRPPGDAAAADADSSTAPLRLIADHLPGYEILREIHRGAQGVVYQALQRTTRRHVAIKIMHERPFAGPHDRLRFEREIQILGQLDHPNIVTIHDSGVVAGSFYYVMHYIAGKPLDVYLADAGVVPRSAALRLFAKICAAVNEAHLHGVIHRDLKPGNILVDAHGQPHVLDFGLAKLAVGSGPDVAPATSAPVMTETGQFLGSLPWASPEQAEGRPERVDVRSDVYALGVILYQILTGRFPYAVSGAPRDVLDNILRTVPARPRSFSRDVDDELETIVLKCLAKERERRYQSAGELARDLERYLAGEPIEAKRDSAWYVLRKTLRRHWAPTVVAGLFALVITTGAVIALSLWRQAVRERNGAEDARSAEVRQRRLAEANADEAAAVNTFLHDMLSAIDPALSQGQEVTVRQVLDEAARRVADGSLSAQPLTEAAVRTTIGASYRALGRYSEAEPHLRAALAIRERVLGASDPAVAQSLHSLGGLLLARRAIGEAEPLLRRALAIRRQAYGNQHLEVAASLNALGSLLLEECQYAEAEQVCREALAIRRKLLGDENTAVAESLSNLANALYKQGDFASGEVLARESLALRRRLLRPDHPDLTKGLNNLASLLKNNGDFAGAEPLYREALAIRLKLLGELHPDVCQSRYNLATVLNAQGKYAEAEPLLRDAVQTCTAAYGADHEYAALPRCQLAECLVQRGEYVEAEQALLEAYEVLAAVGGEQHVTTLDTAGRLASLYERWGKADAAAVWRAKLVNAADSQQIEQPNLAGH